MAEDFIEDSEQRDIAREERALKVFLKEMGAIGYRARRDRRRHEPARILGADWRMEIDDAVWVRLTRNNDTR